jgi:hypothetical protein
VARLGAAWINSGDLEVAAGFVLRLELLQRGGVKLTDGEGARMGGERGGVKNWGSELLYL